MLGLLIYKHNELKGNIVDAYLQMRMTNFNIKHITYSIHTVNMKRKAKKVPIVYFRLEQG